VRRWEILFCPEAYKGTRAGEKFLGIAPNSTSILIKGLMCITVGFSFAPKRTAVRERAKKISQMRAKTLN
jgi:hypothetical protein